MHTTWRRGGVTLGCYWLQGFAIENGAVALFLLDVLLPTMPAVRSEAVAPVRRASIRGASAADAKRQPVSLPIGRTVLEAEAP